MMSKTDFGKLMEETMTSKREEQEQIGYEMLREGGHSVKEIAEAMGVTSRSQCPDREVQRKATRKG